MADVDVGLARKIDLGGSSLSGDDKTKAAEYQQRDTIEAERTQSEIAFWGAMLKADPQLLERRAAEAAEAESDTDWSSIFCDNFLCSSQSADTDSLKQELKMVRVRPHCRGAPPHTITAAG